MVWGTLGAGKQRRLRRVGERWVRGGEGCPEGGKLGPGGISQIVLGLDHPGPERGVRVGCQMSFLLEKSNREGTQGVSSKASLSIGLSSPAQRPTPSIQALFCQTILQGPDALSPSPRTEPTLQDARPASASPPPPTRLFLITPLSWLPTHVGSRHQVRVLALPHALALLSHQSLSLSFLSSSSFPWPSLYCLSHLILGKGEGSCHDLFSLFPAQTPPPPGPSGQG